jgi:large subunit ribosomal protein L53
MITRFITEVNTKFNPFSATAKPARLFLSFLPPNARATGMNISTTLLPRGSADPSSLSVKFSTFFSTRIIDPDLQGGLGEFSEANERSTTTEDGKQIDVDCAKMDIKSIVEEVDRHSRMLQ